MGNSTTSVKEASAHSRGTGSCCEKADSRVREWRPVCQRSVQATQAGKKCRNRDVICAESGFRGWGSKSGLRVPGQAEAVAQQQRLDLPGFRVGVLASEIRARGPYVPQHVHGDGNLCRRDLGDPLLDSSARVNKLAAGVRVCA